MTDDHTTDAPQGPNREGSQSWVKPDTGDGETTAPQVEIIAPPEPDGPPPEPVGRTPEAENGEPPSDESQGVGLAPTQPGDVDEHGEGGDTAFQTTEEIEAKQGGADGSDT